MGGWAELSFTPRMDAHFAAGAQQSTNHFFSLRYRSELRRRAVGLFPQFRIYTPTLLW